MMTITILLPVYNGETTLKETLESLMAQSKKFEELIVIDDGSKDDSMACLKKILDGRREYKLIQNEKQQGLAAVYNKGIKVAKTDLIVTLHQDVILERDSLERLVEPFRNKNVVAADHVVVHPLEVWNKYNFWQKVFFARLAGKAFRGIDGKFDAFRRSALERVGLFNEEIFRTAGEDGDIIFKLKRIGEIVQTKAKIVHVHRIDSSFGWRDVVRKQAQYSEAQGALLARGRIRSLAGIARSFFREFLLLSLLVSHVRYFSFVLILTYSFLYAKIMFLREYKDWRIVTLPFFNIFLLIVSLMYSSRGFIYGKQKI